VILETVGAVLDGTGPLPEDAEFSRVLTPLLFAEAPAAIDFAALMRGAAAARRRLSPAVKTPLDPLPPRAGGEGEKESEEERRQVLALAGRLKARLQPPPRPAGTARFDRLGGEIGFPAFVAQWPDLAIEVPARQLHTHYGALDSDGTLRAERHAARAFCYGPYLNLPAGRYRVGIVGEADAGAEYVAQVRHCPQPDRPALLGERRYVRSSRTIGVVAELAFASDRELRDFEVVVNVASSSVAFAIAAVTIAADRLRSDPED
jgi:hypothetical protein